MAFKEGDQVVDPRDPSCRRRGTVVEIHRNPACLLRSLEIQWHNDHLLEELLETDFGPLDD